MIQTKTTVLAVLVTAIMAVVVSYFYFKKTYISPTSPNSTFAETTALSKDTTLPNLNSKEFARMGKQLFSAFQCSSWASMAGEQDEAERLFLYGYKQGKTFIGALEAEKIKQEDISTEVPIGVTMWLQGPNADFMLGKIQSNAEKDALEVVFKTGDKYNEKDMQKIIAGNKFRDGNCQLIGK